MAFQPHTYRNDSPSKSLLTTISSGCKSPVLKIKFCNLVRPFRYPNSPNIPRYSITVAADEKADREFIDILKDIEASEQIPSIIKPETLKKGNDYVRTGKFLIKFQGKDKPPVYVMNENNELEPIELQDELAPGESVQITYDILRYTKRKRASDDEETPTEHGLSYKLISIVYFPSVSQSSDEVPDEF